MGDVLVVDDEEPICTVLTRWLHAWGYTVRQARSADAALACMAAKPASIMLCDIRMPGHDGWWLLDRIQERWPDTVVVMASGVDDIKSIDRARRSGVADYVPKPFGREMLLQAVARAEADARQLGSPRPSPFSAA